MDKDKRWIYYVIGYAIALLPILFLRDLTPKNEMRYLTIVDDALSNGTFFTFHLNGAIYADKPPLFFWLMMLSKWVCGGYCSWLMIGLFALLPGLVTAGVMHRWTAEEVGAEWRTTATLMLLTSAFTIASVVVLRMDMLMTMFIVLSLRSFWKIRQGKDVGREQWLFPVYLFLALFSKGPIGILMPLVCTVAFLVLKREIRQIGRYWGWRTLVVLLGLCAMWFGAVYAEGGWAYLDNMLFHQTVGRAVNSFRHSHSVFYYCGAIWYIMVPWSLVVVGGIVASFWDKERWSDMRQFMVTVSIATFVMLSLISSKLQVYMLPAIPFMIYSAVLAMPKISGNVCVRVGLTVPNVVYALALPGIIIMAGMEKFAYLDSVFFYASACLLTATGVLALLRLWGAKADTNKAIHVTAVGFLIAIFVGGFGVGNLTF